MQSGTDVLVFMTLRLLPGPVRHEGKLAKRPALAAPFAGGPGPRPGG